MTFPAIHRVVTGHDARGTAIVAHNGPLPTVVEIQAIPGTVFHEVWSTSGAPAPVDNGADPTLGPLMLPPPALGTRMRFVDIPPDTAEFLAQGAGQMKDAFAQIGDEKASTVKAHSPHPLMHRTESVDYGIVIEGGAIVAGNVHFGYTPVAAAFESVKSGAVAELQGALRVVSSNAAGGNRIGDEDQPHRANKPRLQGPPTRMAAGPTQAKHGRQSQHPDLKNPFAVVSQHPRQADGSQGQTSRP